MMASLYAIRISLLFLSVIVFLVTTWFIISGTGLVWTKKYDVNYSCPCSQGNGFDESDSDNLPKRKDTDLPNRKFIQCQYKLKSAEERLNREISRCDEKNSGPEVKARHQNLRKNAGKNCRNFKKVSVIINSKKQVKAFSNNGNVLIPFSVVKKEFEINGDFDEKGNFLWQHAVIQRWKIPIKYDPIGEYAGLTNAFVERRSRVKYVDGIYEVPITNQWDKNGYFYATQVAQYGLAHYSKLAKKQFYEGRSIIHRENKTDLLKGDGEINLVYSKEKKKFVTYFNIRATLQKRLLAKHTKEDRIVSLDLKLDPGSDILVRVRTEDSKMFTLHYTEEASSISCYAFTIKIRIGPFDKWRRITRDVGNDFMKGIATCANFRDKNLVFEGIQKIIFVGSGYVNEVRISETAHLDMLLNAAKFLIKFQDKDGGWPVNATRKIIPGVMSPPGWRSAMASGQAISLFCRVYSYTKQTEYLDAAARALKLFKVPATEGGFASLVMGNLTMFEEYPTQPSLHILNGFIFSLIGLYDLSQVSKDTRMARDLFEEGMQTLIRILPLYDAGSGTYYDLRHVVIPGVEPRRARWAYHAVHLGQLELLMVIKPHPVLKRILNRWEGYVHGKAARHN